MEIWVKGVKDDDYKLDTLEDYDVEEAEKHFNIVLPDAYVKLLHHQNGGFITLNRLPVPFNNDWADGYIFIDYLFGIKKNKGIMESDYYLKEWGIKEKNLVILSGDGHFFVALDYRERKTNPEIVYINTEDQEVVKIYNSFSEMIQNLSEIQINSIEMEKELEIVRLEMERELKKSYVLLESNDTEDILEGILIRKHAIHVPLKDDNFSDKLISFLTHKNMDVRTLSAEYLADYIITDKINSMETIKKVLSILEKTNDKRMQSFKEEINNYLDQN